MVTQAAPPSTPTFSFIAPFPPSSSSSTSPIKQRRVSLALPSSPRLVPAWSFRDDTSIASHVASSSSSSGLTPGKRGKIRKIALSDDEQDDPPQGDAGAPTQEKKARKKWTEEETKMLVKGCNKVSLWLLDSLMLSPQRFCFQHGVGNWKAILKDPEFTFDSRSPVDLKDRYAPRHFLFSLKLI
jgi:hypothetical protein